MENGHKKRVSLQGACKLLKKGSIRRVGARVAKSLPHRLGFLWLEGLGSLRFQGFELFGLKTKPPRHIRNIGFLV